MEEEKYYGKVYDGKIVAKLMEFLIPYRGLIAVVLLATVILAVLNLYLPILIQKIVDSSITVSYTRIKMDKGLSKDYISKLNSIENKFLIENDIYVYKADLGKVFSISWIKEQKKSGVVVNLDYYIGHVDKNTEAIIDKYPSLFLKSHGVFAIDYKNGMSKLSNAEKMKLRKKNIIDIQKGSFLFLTILLLIFFLDVIKNFAMTHSQLGLVKDIKMKLYTKTSKQSLKFLQTNPVGRLVTRMTNDVETVSGFVSTSMNTLLWNVSRLIGSSIAVFILDFKLSLILLETIPVLIVITIFYKKYAREAFRSLRLLIADMNIFLSENLSGIEVLKHFAHEKKSIESFKEKSTTLFVAQKKQLYVFAFFRPLIRFTAASSVAVVIYFSAKEVLEHRISLGVIIAFLNLLDRFYGAIEEIAEVFSQLQQAMAGGEKVFNLMDQEEAIVDEGIMSLKKEETKGALEFKNVHFSYTKDKEVIKDLSFSIKPGNTIALVGYTGSGKTTITNLITRMWDLQNGKILLDGINIKDLKLDNLRTLIQSLQQDVFLFNDTIKNNILMGLDLSDEKLNEIVDLAQLNELIDGVDGGLNHIIEEGSKNVSAGQRQLIAFARILAQNPRVIIMDEATANIDTEIEKKIQVAMDALVHGRTAIVVAHRLSTIQHADKILVLKDGCLAEEGSHHELIQIENGLYQNLYKLQYQENN